MKTSARGWSRWRGLVALAVAGTTTLAPARAAGPDRDADATGQLRAPYVLEIWFELAPGAAPAFDAYAAALRDLAARPSGVHARWVDARVDTGGRVVTLPARTLTDVSAERRADAALEASLPAGMHGDLVDRYRASQVSRTSYLRRVRDDLSVGAAGAARARSWGTEVARVTVVPGRRRDFERVWRRALVAYQQIAPHAEITVAETLVGGGPDYHVMRPLVSPADRGAWPTPVEAVARAGGGDAAAFGRRFDAVVERWDGVVLERTPFDVGTAAAH